MKRLLAAFGLCAVALASDPAPGQITPDLPCAADPAQTYAVYVPSNYSPDRTWPVILAFDPGARGRIPVERYQAAAEQYGYIVAGSNTSRNGPLSVSQAAIRAMSEDVGRRFAINDRRVYLAGMSGGARFALAVALGSPKIAGVIASSAGFPDSKPRKAVGFAIFGTAGTEDFNYVEMRTMDRELTSPHRLRVFQGGHVWLPPEVATEAVEWLELQAVRSQRAPRDQAKIDLLFAKRTAAAQGSDATAYLTLQEIVRDFDGLEDIAEYTARAAALGRDKKVREALKKERDEEDREERQIQELIAIEARLADPVERPSAMQDLRGRWKRLRDAAGGPADTADRRIARRLARAMVMTAAERTKDPEYRKLLEEQRSWLAGR
jgi:dienelactone hydrolase